MPKSKSSDENAFSTLKCDPKDNDLVCGACLMELFSDDSDFIGCPSGCPHLFHWDCLVRWGELQNSCPQCKNRFRIAGKYHRENHELVECIKFKKRNRVDQDSDPSEISECPVDLCEKCREPGNDDDMLLCDGMDFTCNALYHIDCAGFDSVPSGLWFCENCVTKGYVPEEFKKTKKPKTNKNDSLSPDHARNRSRSPSEIRIVPNLFPRKLLVNYSANQRATSSGVPSKLVLQVSDLIPAKPNQQGGADPVASVYARFRQRRLEKKNQSNKPPS
jgi:hypothetical protein